MTNHPPLESLSALVDDDLNSAERARLESHLESCSDCSALWIQLSDSAGRVRSLPRIHMSPEEQQRLRQALPPAEGRGRARRWFAPGFAAVAAVIIGIGIFVFRDRTAEPGPPAIIASGTLQLDDPSDVRRVAGRLPEVKSAIDRYSARSADLAADPHTEKSGAQPPAGSAGTRAEGQEDASAQQAPLPARGPEASDSRLSEPLPGENFSAPGSGVPSEQQFSPSAGRSCLERVAASQPYRVLPLSARKADFAGRPSWLLTLAWTDSRQPDAKLDRIQVWLFSPSDCAELSGADLLNRALHYTSF